MKKALSMLMALIFILSAVPFAVNAAQTNRLVFMSLGDSVAQGAGLSDRSSDVYGAIVCKKRNYDFINDAVGGYTSEDLLKQVTDTTHPNYCGADIMKADIICISIGGNDILKDPEIAPAFYSGSYLALCAVFSLKSATLASTIKGNVEKTIARIRELNPKAVILYQNIYNPVFSSETVRSLAGIGLTVFNSSITSIDKNVYVPDAYSAITSESMMNSDKIHPNESGHRAIAEAVDKCLTEALSSSGQSGTTTPVTPPSDTTTQGGESSILSGIINIIIGLTRLLISILGSISELIK